MTFTWISDLVQELGRQPKPKTTYRVSVDSPLSRPHLNPKPDPFPLHRSGHLFQGRFKAQVVEADSYACSLLVYIHLNPVRPKDKKQVIPLDRSQLLKDYVWSSHRVYSGYCRTRDVPGWLSVEWLWYFGRSRSSAQREYRKQIAASFGRCVASPLEAVQGGLVLGSERLWEKVKGCIGKSSGQEEIAWSRRAGQAERQRRVEESLKKEGDRRYQIWARVRLGGERPVDVARKYGLGDGSGVYRVVRRLEALGEQDRQIGARLKVLSSQVRHKAEA